MAPIHSLLKRQLKRCFGEGFATPREWQAFIEAVNEAYREFDVDREMLERSLDLSSQELLSANSEARAFFLAIPDLLFRLDEDGKILDFKAGTTSEFMIQPQDLFGKRIQDVPVKRVGDQFRDALRRVSEGGRGISIEDLLTLKGKELFYEARLAPLPDNQRIAIIRNITERKEAEHRLKQAEAEYRSIFENA